MSFSVGAGETLGLVGESGCGKTPTGRAILRLVPVTSGDVRFGGTSLLPLSTEAMRRQRRRMQIVFQDPFASLNPRHTVAEIVDEPLRVHNLVPPRARAAGA